MEGAPADMGDWGITRVFHEAGRLLRKHLRDLLPTILLCVFPATLIKVLRAQYFLAAFGGPPGSSYFPQPTSFWLLLLRGVLLGLFFALPVPLIVIALLTVAQFLNDLTNINDLKAECHCQPLYRTVKLLFSFRLFQQRGGSSQVRIWDVKWKVLKGSFAVYLSLRLWDVMSESGMYFTPEAVTAMGLPPWTIFLITLLIVTVTTVITSYSLLLGLVMVDWITSPKTQILMCDSTV